MKKGKSMCAGCWNNFYNGNNPYGISECWNLKRAEVVKRKKIPISLPPPYDHIKPCKVLSCYGEKGYVFWE